MTILTKEGFGALRFGYLVFVAGLGVSATLATASYLYWQVEKKNNVQSQRTLGDVESRLANARRERDDLRNSEDTYKALTARGVFVTEQRLDLLEAMEALKIRHGIVNLEYEMSQQRPLKLATGGSGSGGALSAIDALGSRIKIKVGALHDGDMLAFMAEFPRMQRGLFPVDRCVFKRSADASGNLPLLSPLPPLATTQSPPTQGGNLRSNIDDDAINVSGAALSPAQRKPKVTIEAECSLEWITLLDKRAPITSASTAATSTPPTAGGVNR